MPKIASVSGGEILDSRGNPTLSVTVTLSDGSTGTAKVPSGASTGSGEALELRDGDATRYRGKGVLKALGHVEGELAKAVRGIDAEHQVAVDDALRAADGTANKSRLGANAILGVSLAVAHAAAASRGVPLYRHIAILAGRASALRATLDGPSSLANRTDDRERRANQSGNVADSVLLPLPLMNVLNGGAHADTSVDFQEFMLAPVGFAQFSEGLRAGVETYHALHALLDERGLATGVGDEGGFAPQLARNEEAAELLTRAIERAGYRPGDEVALALDPAASEFHKDGRYVLAGEGRTLDAGGMVDLYADWLARFPIISIEDGMAENDWDGWTELTHRLGSRVQLVGDDVFVTNPELIRRGGEKGVSNAVLVKLNQIGTLSETLEAVDAARLCGWASVISHRSGETDDATVADLAVGAATGQIKAGAPARGERVAKYNRLLAIEREAAGQATYAAQKNLSVLK